MFCYACGQTLSDKACFCAHCGQQQTSPPQQECVVWLLGVHRKTSFLKRIPCTLVFTDQRLLLAHLSRQRQNQEARQMAATARARGEGFFKGSVSLMKQWAHYQDKYLTMAPQQILAEEADNLALAYPAIERFVFRAYSHDTDSDGSTQTRGGTIKIKASGVPTLRFSHSFSHSKSLQASLARFLGHRLTYRR